MAPPPLPSANRHPNGAHPPGRRRRGKLRSLTRRLQERNRARREGGGNKDGDRKRRKAAFAISVGVMGLSTAAMVPPKPAPALTSPAARQRKPATLLTPSHRLLSAMIQEEGARLTVYRDVAGNPTVGVGHLVTSVDNLHVGDRISEDQALDLLEQDLGTAQQAVRHLVGDLPLYQNEYDALVDLAFNVGEGNLAPERSPELNAAIMSRNYDAIAEQLDYHHAAGHMAMGLVYRSERRANIFSDASYADPRDADEASVAI